MALRLFSLSFLVLPDVEPWPKSATQILSDNHQMNPTAKYGRRKRDQAVAYSRRCSLTRHFLAKWYSIPFQKSLHNERRSSTKDAICGTNLFPSATSSSATRTRPTPKTVAVTPRKVSAHPSLFSRGRILRCSPVKRQ